MQYYWYPNVLPTSPETHTSASVTRATERVVSTKRWYYTSEYCPLTAAWKWHKCMTKTNNSYWFLASFWSFLIWEDGTRRAAPKLTPTMMSNWLSINKSINQSLYFRQQGPQRNIRAHTHTNTHTNTPLHIHIKHRRQSHIKTLNITRIWHVPAKHANRMDARAHSSTLAECAPKKKL